MKSAQLVLVIAAATIGVVVLAVLASIAPLEWPLGPMYLRLAFATVVVNVAATLIWNPVLIRRRMSAGKGWKTWDMVLMVPLVVAMVAVFVVAGVDAGNWASGRPGPRWLSGAILFVLGWALVTWGMAVNPFFEKVVRIQSEHGHHVIEAGPYRYVRHPGYVGFSLWMLSTPLLLMSTWAMVPAVIAVVTFVVRTALEDRTLQAELPGYAEYASRTRFRLIPGLW